MERASEACRDGNLEFISTLADRDLHSLITRTDEDGRSLLHAAASSGSAPLLDFLVERGAGPMVHKQDDEVNTRCFARAQTQSPLYCPPRSLTT